MSGWAGARRAGWCLMLAAAATGCRSAGDAGTSGGAAAGGTATAGAATAQATPHASAGDTAADCGLVRSTAYPDPGALIREYVQRDGAGEFVHRAPWLDTVYQCPHRLTEPAGYRVVAFSSIVPLPQTDSVAPYAVQSAQLGAVTRDAAGPSYAGHRSSQVDTLTIVRTAYGWRVASPQLPHNVLASEILAAPSQFRLVPASRTALAREWADAVRGTGGP